MAFDLSELLAGVSDPSTREQIEYINRNLIESDVNNFYQLSDIEGLAANIQLCGLQQPLRVRKINDDLGCYRIVSGHRRFAAIEMLAEDDPERWGEVSCIVENDEASESLQQLRLIYANANTRVMTSAEVSEQAVRVEKLLYQLKEEGYEFPGRMRDHVAQAVQVSRSKLARLKVIRDNLAFSWQSAWKDGKLGESTAYALAQLPAPWQDLIFAATPQLNQLYEGTVKEYAKRFEEIQKTGCGPKKDRVCGHKTIMMENSCKGRWCDPCRTRCCLDCPSLRTCRTSCATAESKKKELRDAHIADAAATAKQIAERDKPTLDVIAGVYARVGRARRAANVSVAALCEAQGKRYAETVDEEKQLNLEHGTAKLSTTTTLPFGYSFYADNAKALCKVADLLQVSTDYLLGRTEVREVASEAVSTLGTAWKTGNPEAYGTYVAYVQIADVSKKMLRELLWDGEEWFLFGSKIADDVKVCCWMEQPEL